MALPDNLQAARYLASQQWPYLSSALWSIQPVETKGLGTLGVDKWWRLYYDPALPWDVKTLASVLYHEMSHLLRLHPERAERVLDLDPQAWNICADAEINDDIIKEANVKFPDGVITPSSIKQADGLLAEEYYNNLPKLTIKLTPKGGGTGKCGSCAGGPKQAHELDGPAKTGDGTSDVPGISEIEADLIRRQVANEIKESSKTQGNMPEHWKRYADAILTPKVDWRKVLRAQIKHSLAQVAGQVDYSFKRPSRKRHVTPRIIMPSMVEPVARVVGVWDTSGSMGQEQMDAIMAEADGVMKSCGLRESMLWVVGDAAVTSAKKVWKANQIELGGGGGTDMRVLIERALKDKPHIVIVFTDGYTPWPDEPIRAKMIVALVGNADAASCPTWAKVVKIGDKA